MSVCALKKFKIDLLSTENTVDSVTKQIIMKWLTSDEIRNSGIKQASIVILHRGFDTMFWQSSSAEWGNIYLDSEAYNIGDKLFSNIFFDDSDRLLNSFVVQPWALLALQAAQNDKSEKWAICRIDYLNNLYDDYRNLGGFSLGYSDPIRDNRVYFSFVMNTASQPITRNKISGLYKKMKELYLEMLPYAVCAIINRDFTEIDKYKKLLSNINSHHEVFKNLKQDQGKFNNQGMTCLI